MPRILGLLKTPVGQVVPSARRHELNQDIGLASRGEFENGHLHPSKELIYAILGRKLTVITTFMRETVPAGTLSRD